MEQVRKHTDVVNHIIQYSLLLLLFRSDLVGEINEFKIERLCFQILRMMLQYNKVILTIV